MIILRRYIDEESDSDTKLSDEKINALIQQNVKQSLANIKAFWC